jgi:hypothetical protein
MSLFPLYHCFVFADTSIDRQLTSFEATGFAVGSRLQLSPMDILNARISATVMIHARVNGQSIWQSWQKVIVLLIATL